MEKQIFVIKAVWDEEAKVFYSDSNIIGLHFEAPTIEEFERIMHDNALDLVVANHIKPEEFARKSLADLIPTIFVERDSSGMVAA